MARDPMRVLLAMRQRSIEQTRQALASCLRAEAEANETIRLIDRSIQRDREADTAADDLLGFGDMFAMRRSSAQAERRNATATLAAAELRSSDARGLIAEARMAAESVQRLINERATARGAEASRQEQHALDDIARPRLGKDTPSA